MGGTVQVMRNCDLIGDTPFQSGTGAEESIFQLPFRLTVKIHIDETHEGSVTAAKCDSTQTHTLTLACSQAISLFPSLHPAGLLYCLAPSSILSEPLSTLPCGNFGVVECVCLCMCVSTYD